MNFLFLDTSGIDYDPETPMQKPLGGTQSAIAYLSEELVKAGATVTLMNNPSRERVVKGVRLVESSTIGREGFDQFDIVVVVSVALGVKFRQVVPKHIPMVLYCHHAADQVSVSTLRNAEERAVWDAFVMVSDWQLNDYAKVFGVEPTRAAVIGNAVSPAFLERPLQPAWFEIGAPPVLTYTSTAFRGLEILLLAFPSIRARLSGAELKIFSGININTADGLNDPNAYLYEVARSLAGVTHHGSVSQKKLADVMGNAAALTYPSIFAETFCIAAVEALASGAEVLTTRLGALPDVLNGLGQFMNMAPSQRQLAQNYIEFASEALAAMKRDPAAAAARRQERTQYVRTHFTWARRAQQWLDLADQIKRRKG
ncbi:glycosyltransferase family 4 protein [Agrobacterium vitis]|uniref:Glycosyltransferase n=1 Tax=Agrobacterium vitis TaxID=373 RepID=A0AAE4WF74_AGRVI|nr:glycosyltransferase family 4 protein [Agrobacterium vitis]MCF1500190.1 glycosyltransferase family 4 protein [Allorhizobium sp. Av2]MCM2441747.1 glycosyltransferase family 4 protein [Agrobacterium vitis]MUZ58995.1 glycosyltransferase [Agrobacterium vitis]MVA68651.1 glycosyltransferase [Agrobacterium vitis]MVA88637.1 glycosyltransferase [Agrobacterium vitis]